MSSQTTRTITRKAAVARITKIVTLHSMKDYWAIYDTGFEVDYAVQQFVDSAIPNTHDIEKWTIKMLEDVMDKPFFRYSMFDNYWVIE